MILSTLTFGCDNIKVKILVSDVKKSALRYFITINYSEISNEMHFSEGEYLNSLYSEIATFSKTINKDIVREKFFSTQDPFDFAVSITKELD